MDLEKARLAHLSFYTRHKHTGKVYPIIFIEFDGKLYRLYELDYKKLGQDLYEYSITIDEDYILQKAKAEGKI